MGFCRRISSVVLLFVGFPLLCAGAGQRNGRKYTPPPATATIKVTVLRATNGKPISNAAVVFHPMEGDKDKGALELKSDEDGKVTIDVIPVGDTVRLQVIADGWKTYGDDYKIDTDSNRDVSIKYGISAIPTVILFKNGQVAQKFVGLRQEREFKEALDAV